VCGARTRALRDNIIKVVWSSVEWMGLYCGGGWCSEKKKSRIGRAFVWRTRTGNFQGVRKRGRGGRALPRPDRAASLAANTRLFWNLPDWLISRTIDRLHHNAAVTRTVHEVTWPTLGKARTPLLLFTTLTRSWAASPLHGWLQTIEEKKGGK
jgi:hypothetical protein